MASDENALRLDRFLCFALYAASHAFNRLYKPWLDELGLTYPQYLAMVVLWDADDRTVGAIGEALALDSNTLTPLLKRLQAAGLVDRVRSPVDERQVRIRLTPAGRALRHRAEAVPGCIAAATGLDAAKAETLIGDLDALRKTLLQAAASRGDAAPALAED